MKTKNNFPTSEFEEKDKCPSCGSYCNIHTDLDDNDECNDCRHSCKKRGDKEEITKETKNKEAINLIDEIYKLQDTIIKKANTEILSGVYLSTKIELKDIIKICEITQDKSINAIHKLTIEDEAL